MLFPECINWAHRSLENAVSKFPDHSVGWGNTNLKPRDYLFALELAEKSGRPIRFVRSGFELEPVTLQSLIRRNIGRYLKTGRYIPCSVLDRTLITSNRMLQEQWVTPELLCNAVGYTLNEANGRVKKQQQQQQQQQEK